MIRTRWGMVTAEEAALLKLGRALADARRDLTFADAAEVSIACFRLDEMVAAALQRVGARGVKCQACGGRKGRFRTCLVCKGLGTVAR